MVKTKSLLRECEMNKLKAEAEVPVRRTNSWLCAHHCDVCTKVYGFLLLSTQWRAESRHHSQCKWCLAVAQLYQFPSMELKWNQLERWVGSWEVQPTLLKCNLSFSSSILIGLRSTFAAHANIGSFVVFVLIYFSSIRFAYLTNDY
jgi:hypothetical protein